MTELLKALERAVNGHEAPSNTPDFIMARFLHACFEALHQAVHEREAWYGRENTPPGSSPSPPEDEATSTRDRLEHSYALIRKVEWSSFVYIQRSVRVLVRCCPWCSGIQPGGQHAALKFEGLPPEPLDTLKLPEGHKPNCDFALFTSTLLDSTNKT